MRSREIEMSLDSVAAFAVKIDNLDVLRMVIGQGWVYGGRDGLLNIAIHNCSIELAEVLLENTRSKKRAGYGAGFGHKLDRRRLDEQQ